MRCPVCDKETQVAPCGNCGFQEFKTEFLTQEDYELWQECTVKPCQQVYQTLTKNTEKRITALETKIRTLEARLYGNGSEQVIERKSLKEFFVSNGFKVVDKRASGGRLWVVGSPKDLEPCIRVAQKYYNLGDHKYSSGRATDGKPGWFTTSKD